MSPERRTNRCVVISGCSGGGKSTLLAELALRGYTTVEEPGRRIVQEQMARGGSALPWIDIAAFLHRAFQLAVENAEPRREGVTFFDRGMIDAAIGLQQVTGRSAAKLLQPYARYDPTVFLAPPWPDIFVTDIERRHSFDDAVAEYERLMAGFPRLGYRVVPMPKADVSHRADFVLAALGQ